MTPGGYPEPLLRTTWVMAPMVSGYVGSRLRIADYAFGTNYAFGTTATTNLTDNEVHMIVENTYSTTDVSATGVNNGTNVYFQMQQTLDDGPSGVRQSISPQYGVVPGGRVVVDFYVGQPFIEFLCVGGGGSIRAQLSSRLKWEQMALSRTDTFGAPQLFNQELYTLGVVAPPPFPTS